MAEIDGDRIAVQGILPQLFTLQRLLLCFGLGLRDVRRLLWSVRAVAINGLSLRGGHLGGVICLGAGYRFCCLELLHGRRKLLLPLLVLGIVLRLQTLLRFEARHLLRIRRSRSHR